MQPTLSTSDFMDVSESRAKNATIDGNSTCRHPTPQLVTSSSSSRHQPREPPPEQDDYDALLADIDVDQLVSQNHQSTSCNDNNSSPEFAQFNGSFEHQANFPQNPSDEPMASNFDYGRLEGAPQLNYGGATPVAVGSFHTNSSNWNCSNTPNTSSGFRRAQIHPDEARGSFLPQFVNDASTPLCPGHQQPCRILIANTAANAGREFYKCSLPEGQACDFFQWVDGMEGNLNSTGGDGGLIRHRWLQSLRAVVRVRRQSARWRAGGFP